MTNNEFIKYLEYNERVMRELHGVKVALPFTAALNAAKSVVDASTCNCNCQWRATGAAPEVESGRDGWAK